MFHQKFNYYLILPPFIYLIINQLKLKDMTRDKKEFIEAILSWFNTPKVGNDEVLDRKFLASAYDNITQPHWISVEDELPPRNVFVLTCDGQENENLLMLAGDDRWYDKAVGLHRNITHWMPLPQAPKKGDEE